MGKRRGQHQSPVVSSFVQMKISFQLGKKERRKVFIYNCDAVVFPKIIQKVKGVATGGAASYFAVPFYRTNYLQYTLF